MVMAGSLATRNDSPTPEQRKEERFQEVVAEAIARGATVGQISRKLAKGDKRKYHRYYSKITRLAKVDPKFQARIAQSTNGEMWLDLGAINKAVTSRAKRGRMDAVKAVWAATGFHNDRVDHNHSGEIQISVNIPRPTAVEDHTALNEAVVDAEVVED